MTITHVNGYKVGDDLYQTWAEAVEAAAWFQTYNKIRWADLHNDQVMALQPEIFHDVFAIWWEVKRRYMRRFASQEPA